MHFCVAARTQQVENFQAVQSATGTCNGDRDGLFELWGKGAAQDGMPGSGRTAMGAACFTIYSDLLFASVDALAAAINVCSSPF